MLIKYYINNSKKYKNKFIRISSHSDTGRHLLNKLKRCGYYISRTKPLKLPLHIKELDITIIEIIHSSKD